MNCVQLRAPLVALALFACLIETAHAADAAASPVAAGSSATGTAINEIVVIAHRLDEARNSLLPETGSTVYRFAADDIAALPLGDNTPLNQLLLQSPGIVQDSFGQLHARGDHANLQYRVNGIIIPESISGFGQSLDARFADQINVLTGALPAQYGYRTAGIVDIRTKGSHFENAGRVSFLGGSYDHLEPSAEVSGSVGALSAYVTGSYLQDSVGIENPTPARDAIHDDTTQGKAFGYASYILTPQSRISLVAGYSGSTFGIPASPGQMPVYTLAGAAPLPSEELNANQREGNRFEILAYQATAGDSFTYQVALFNRYTFVHYQPDPVGDLTYNGVAADIVRTNDSYGLQADASYRPASPHTLRWGAYYSRERAGTTNASTVFPADDSGAQTSQIPIVIQDPNSRTASLIGVYLQDEWQPTGKLTINYGVRFDQVDAYVKEHQWSPRFGVVYQLTDSTALHAGYARYFTPPPTEKIQVTSVGKFLNTTNALPSDANTSVTSERSHYFDVGVVHQLIPGLTLGLDGYYRQVKNLQDEGQFGNALIFSPFNYEKGRIYGVELSSSYKKDWLGAYWNLAWSKAEGKEIVSGQFNFDPGELAFIATNWVHLDHDQEWSSSAGITADWHNVNYSLSGLFGSGLRRGFANSEHLPAYFQMDLGARHTFGLGSLGALDASISVLNLFDRVYQLRDGSGIGVGAPQYGTRRAFYVGVSKAF